MARSLRLLTRVILDLLGDVIMVSRLFAAAGALAAVLSLANSASAGVIVGSYTLESGSFGGQLGVHSTGSQSGVTTASGFVNQDGSAVSFSSTGLFDLLVNGQGEATIVGDPTLANLTVSFAKLWGAVTFDLETVNKTDSVMTLLVNGTDLFSGAVCGSLCDLSNGANKFVLTGPNIQTLTFNFDPAIDDAKQFRLNDTSDVQIEVPEPATWVMMLAGFGLMVAMLRGRRRGLARV
jgi:hypothetical protein